MNYNVMLYFDCFQWKDILELGILNNSFTRCVESSVENVFPKIRINCLSCHLDLCHLSTMF